MRIKKVILSLVVLTFIVTISLLPYGISYGFKKWLTENGGEQVKVGDVDFSLLSATFALYDLEIQKQGDTALKLPELQIRLTWTPFMSKKALINQVLIKGVTIEIDRSNPERILIGGITLPEATAAANEKQDIALPWGFAVDKFEILDSKIHYLDEKLDIHFNIDAFKLTGLASYHPEQPVKLELKGAINEAPIMLISQATPFSKTPSLKSQINLQGFSLGLLGKLAEPDISHIDGQLTIETLLSANYQADKTLLITQKGEISLKQFDIKREADHLEAGHLQWGGDVQLQLSSQGKPQTIAAAGTIQLAALENQPEAQSPTFTLQDAGWQGTINHQAEDAGEKTDIEGELTLNDLQINIPGSQAELKQQALSWRGKLHLEKPLPGTAQQITLQGTLESTNLDAHAQKEAIELSYGNVAWHGDLMLSQGGDDEKMELTGQIDIDQLQALSSNEGYLLLAFDQLNIEKIAADLHDGAISSEQIEMKQLAVGRALEDEGPGLLRVENLKVKGINYSALNGIHIQSIEPQNLTHLTSRNKEGRWSEQQLLDIIQRITASKGSDQPAQPKATKGEAEKPPLIRIDNILVQGGSRLKFQDDLPDPPHQAELNIHRFSLDGLNSAEPTKSSPLALDATLNQQSSLKLKGSVAPFAPKLTLSLKGKLEGFGLPPLTSYTGSLLGYSLDSGELNADITFDTKAGNIEGDNKLKLHHLEVSPLSEEKMKGLKAQLDVPLDTALGMLRDTNNTIALSLPLSGSVDDLKVDPSDVINQAIGKALKKGATTYLTAALFPFGTMLAIAKIAGEEAAKIRLDPILFTPGSNKLQSKNAEYLGKISKILRERPEVHIKLCGRAVEADQIALLQVAQQKLDQARAAEKKAKGEKAKLQTPIKPKPITEQQLHALANKRVITLESYLAEKEGVKKNRLISCQPLTELDDKEDKPRVELLL